MSGLDNALTMIAACATVQTLLAVTGEADPAAAALARCIADDGGELDWIDSGNASQGRAADGSTIAYQPPICLVLDGGTTATPLEAPNVQRHYGDIGYRLFVPQPDASVYPGTTLTRWCRDQQAAIRAELLALAGQPGCFSRFTVGLRRPTREANRAGPFGGAQMLPIDLHWE